MNLSNLTSDEIYKRIPTYTPDMESDGESFSFSQKLIEHECDGFFIRIDLDIHQPYSYSRATHLKPEEYNANDAIISTDNFEVWTNNGEQIEDAEVLNKVQTVFLKSISL